MADILLSPRLRVALIELVKIETSILTAAHELSPSVSPHPGASSLIADIAVFAREHIGTIRARLRGAGADPGTDKITTHRSPNLWLSDLHPISGSLREMFTLLNEAIIGYAMIQPIAVRFRDSWVIATDGTTAHLARSHTQEYAEAAGRVMGLIHDVIIRELDAEGLECQCACPACSIGICIGAPSCRSILKLAFETGWNCESNEGVHVYPPRAGSSAERAGLQPGDVILSVAGARIDSFSRLQIAIKNREPDDQIRFKVRRGTADLVFNLEARRDIRDDRTNGQDVCIQPSSEEFTMAQAIEIHHRLRQENGGSGNNRPNLGSLTPREIQILRLIAEGANNPMIAAELVISRATVARHVANILAKLRLTNRTEAATLATEAGLLSRV